MKNRFCLVVGDWSHDGHEKTERVFIETDSTKEEIQEAYARGAAKLNVDLVQDYCCDYEDSSIGGEALLILIQAGFDPCMAGEERGYSYLQENLEGEVYADLVKGKKSPLTRQDILSKPEALGSEFNVGIATEDWIAMYMFIVSMGDESIRYNLNFNTHNNDIHIGGYGLFN